MAALAETRRELVDQIQRRHGLCAVAREGACGPPLMATRKQDDVVMVEVVTDTFDRAWWRTYSATLAKRFAQDTIHVRALPVEMPDEGTDEQTIRNCDGRVVGHWTRTGDDLRPRRI